MAKQAQARELVIHVGRIETANFTFEAYGHTQDQVLAALRMAWAKHKRETGATMTWAEVEPSEIPQRELGRAYRDGWAL